MSNYKEYYDTFNKLGYQTNIKGAEYFFSLLDEIRDLLRNGVEDEELLRVIPSICLEEYHFHLEVGGKLYKERIRSKITFYVKKDNIIKEYRVIFAIPTYILSV